MWIVIKYKSKNLNILKSSMIKKISVIPTYYCPKIKIHKYINNRLKEFEKFLLEGYLLCYHKKFEDNFFLAQLKNIKGLEYILPNVKKNQKDIIRFVNYCKSFEGSNGYLMSTFFDNLKTKYAEFLSGPFTNMIFEIILEQKNKLKILIGNSTATIEKSKYHYQSC